MIAQTAPSLVLQSSETSRSSPGSWCLGRGELRTVPDPEPGSLGTVGECPRPHGCRNNSWPTRVENLKPPGPFFHVCPPWVLSGTGWVHWRVGQEGRGCGLQDPWAEYEPLNQHGWSSMEGDLQHLWQGGVKQNCFTCRNCLSQGSVFRQISIFQPCHPLAPQRC